MTWKNWVHWAVLGVAWLLILCGHGDWPWVGVVLLFAPDLTDDDDEWDDDDDDDDDYCPTFCGLSNGTRCDGTCLRPDPKPTPVSFEKRQS